MSLKLSKNSVPAYDYISESGSMTNPLTRSVIIDKTGGTKTSSTATIYLVASQAGNTSIGSYTGISITASDADGTPDGITWQLSLNGTDWVSTIAPSNMFCDVTDAVTTIYARIVVNNASNTPAATGNYAGKFEITAVENPVA